MPKHLIQAGTGTKAVISAMTTAIEGQWYWTTDTDEYYFGKSDGTVAGPLPGDPTDSDNQTLSLSGTTLNISGGNSQDLASINYWSKSGSNLNYTSGKVGIGAAPTYRLDIQSTDGTPFRIRHTGAGNIYLPIQNSAHTWTRMIEGGEFKFAKSGQPVSLRMGTTGNVAIGNVSPTQKLHIDGSVRIKQHLYDRLNTKGVYDQVLRSRTNGVEWVDEVMALWTPSGSSIYYSSGNVGIGTSFPARLFEVRGSQSNDFYPFRFRNTNTGDVWLEIQNNTASWQFGLRQGNFTFWGPANNTLQLNTNGNVGIGGAPLQQLDVYGDIRMRGHIHDINAATGSTGQVLKRVANGVQWSNESSGLWSQNGVDIYYNIGYVGIGTSIPDSLLHIDGVSSNGVIHIEGNSTTYTNAYLRLTANNSTNTKALGVYMFDAGGDVEWFMGRGSTSSDRFVIARKLTATHAVSTVASANVLFEVNNVGDLILDNYSNTRDDLATHDPDNHLYFGTDGKLLTCERLYQHVRITNAAVTQELNNVAWTEVTAFDNAWFNSGGFSYEGGFKHKLKVDENGLYRLDLALNITSTGTDVGLEVGVFINGSTTPYQTMYYGVISGANGIDKYTIIGTDLFDLSKNAYLTIKCRRLGTDTTSIKLSAANKSHYSLTRQSIG